MDESKLKNLTDLTEEELDAITGGYILDFGADCGDSCRWALVRDGDGEVVCYASSRESIENLIPYKPLGKYSYDVITLDDYERIYGKGLWD